MNEGGKDQAARQGVVGERRLLTIVFCDLADFTPLSQRMDPEDFAELILAYQDAGKRIYTSYGGYVAQFLGDGLLVYFGYPKAHENDAERSVRASLDLLEELKVISDHYNTASDDRLAARIGIHTGLSVVGQSEGTERSIIFGEAVNIASRIEGVAQHNTIAVSETTRELLKDKFELKPLEKQPLKGVSEPLDLFEIQSTSETKSKSRAWLKRYVFVDRIDEIDQLNNLWDEVRAGQRRTLIISADPGVGKSGLINQFHQSVSNVPHTWLEAHSEALSTGRTLHPFIALIRQGLGIKSDMPIDQQHDRLNRSLADISVSLETTFPLMAELLGVPKDENRPHTIDSPEQRRQQTLDTIVLWIEHIAQSRPLVLVCEDLHWADATTVELLTRLITRKDDLPIFCILTKRTEFKNPALDRSKTIALKVLVDEDAAELVNVRAESRDLPAKTVEEILERSAGNPLYIEELTKSIVQSGGQSPGTVGVPDTLDGLIMSQLDRLPPDTKRVAQTASTMGRSFNPKLLLHVSELSNETIEIATRELIDSDILRTDAVVDDKLQFRHALTQDAAYYSLLKRERRAIHSRTADVLKTEFPEFTETRPDILAYHLAGSAQYIDAARWYKEAGRQAAEKAAVEDAVHLYERGLEALYNEKPENRPADLELSLQILLGNGLMGVRGFGSDEVVPVWNRALELAEQLDDTDETTSALNGLAAYYIGTGDCHKAVEYGEKILAIAVPKNHRIGQQRAHSSISTALMQIGEAKKAKSHAEKAIDLYRPADFQHVTYGVGTDQGVVTYGALASAHWSLGNQDKSLETVRHSVDIAKGLDSVLTRAYANGFLALIHHQRRETELAHAVASENEAFCKRYNILFWQGFSQMIRGGQNVDPAPQRLIDLAQGLEILGQSGSKTGISLGFALLADANLAAGNVEPAIAIFDTGLQMAEMFRQPFWNAEILRQKGEALLLIDQHENAGQALNAAHDIAVSQGALSLELRSALSLAKYRDQHNANSDGKDLVRNIYNRFTEGFETPDLIDSKNYIS